ncbi:glycosyltransferase family 2 protein [Candidatus Woesearchaeota archaeon]|nr:MAG: hypothetical protein QT09_C0016G0047 [archaeon GW2011_AR18]MBS3162237.1 glycosyltransferase family 2 protein [Candidatus Woesearchaeota archaeon]HIH25566.1 glycosyltransferase family 2 protein [Nanoarchaeota archaeon]
MLKYSIVIPAYNEERVIGNTIDKTVEFFRKQKGTFEIIIANDGSKDQTSKIVLAKIKKYKELRLYSNEVNQGRGAVLSNAFKTSKGEILVYIDADLAIDINLFPKLINAIEEKKVDIAIGSKHLKESEVEYPKIRRLFSKAYFLCARLLLGTSVKDYQCGFKAFKREALLKILPYVHSKGWTWDTETIVKSIWAGYKVAELPAKVVNVYGRESKVNLLKDVKTMGKGLLRLRKEKKEFLRNFYSKT